MTQRSRVLSILSGETPDQVPWFADLDYWATSLIYKGERPEDFKLSDSYIDWHRELGAGFYLQGYFPFRETPRTCTVRSRREGNRRYRSIETPEGTLRECWQWSNTTCSESPVERLVKSEADLPAYRYFYEDLEYEDDYSRAMLRESQIGDIGIVLCYTPRTPFMNLVSIDAGIENVVAVYMNAPDELASTLGSIKNSMDKAVALTVKSPAEVVMIPENLSAEVVGPLFFEEFVREHQTDWVTKIGEAGKFSTMHMDGTLKGLLRQEASVGFTFIEALTPAPVGDLSIEEWPGYLEGTNAIGWGGIPGSYFTDQVEDAEFDEFVINAISFMRREPRYVLGVADQVPPDGLERRVARVRELVDEYGRY